MLAMGALVATGLAHGRRRAPAQAGHGQVPKKDDRAQRILRKPRFGAAVLIGAACGTLGANISRRCMRSSLGNRYQRVTPGRLAP